MKNEICKYAIDNIYTQVCVHLCTQHTKKLMFMLQINFTRWKFNLYAIEILVQLFFCRISLAMRYACKYNSL